MNNDHQSNTTNATLPSARCFTLVRFTRGSLDIFPRRAHIADETVESRRTVYNCCNASERGGGEAKPGTAGNLGLAGVKVGIAKLQWMWGRQTASFLFFSLLLIKLTLSSQCPTYCNRILTTLCPANLPLSTLFFLMYSFLFLFCFVTAGNLSRPSLVLVFYVSLHL